MRRNSAISCSRAKNFIEFPFCQHLKKRTFRKCPFLNCGYFTKFLFWLPITQMPGYFWGCTEIFMCESTAYQHRRESTYTVPYVPTIAFCANARPRTLDTLPDDASRLMPGVPTQRLVGLRPPPCVVPPRKPIGFRQRTATRKPAFAGHESSRNQS